MASSSSSSVRPLTSYSDEDLAGLSVKELKILLATNNVDSSMCLEKSELINLAQVTRVSFILQKIIIKIINVI